MSDYYNPTPPDSIPYLSRVDQTFYVFNPNTAPTGFSEWGINNDPGGSTAAFDTLLVSYGTNVSDPAQRRVFPRTWNDFVTQVRINGFGQASAGDVNSGPLFEGFYNDYQTILQLTNPTEAQGMDPTQSVTIFNEVFTRFLDTFPFNVDKNPDGTPGPTDGAAGPTAYFMTQWRDYLTTMAVNQLSTASGQYENQSVFTQIYYAFFPNGSEQEFEVLRNKFVADIRADKKFYLPSQMLADWYVTVQTAYQSTNLEASSIQGTHSDRMDIMWKIFNLAVSMIGTLQGIATVEAERLSFLTNYQKSYTDLMNSIPVFAANDGTIFSSNSAARQDLNPKNQTYTQNLQAYRTILQNQAQTLQSNINQLNDAINQQGSLCTSIIQEQQSILSSIFR